MPAQLKQIKLPTLNQFDIKNKLVLIRSDFNVPIKNSKVRDNTRIRASLETIQYCLNQNSKVILISHLGRPKQGAAFEQNKEFTLRPIANRLIKLLNQDVEFVVDWKNFNFKQSDKKIFLLENIRFEHGETTCQNELSQQIAKLADLVVIDAFGTAHRKHASTYGAVIFSKKACAGLLLAKEVNNLTKALVNPVAPILAIVGGAKVSTKLEVLDYLLARVDHLILGGGIANTFLLAKGYHIGNSLVEVNFIEKTLQIIEKAKEKSVNIHLPTDVMVTKDFNNPIDFEAKNIAEVLDDDIIMDVAEKSSNQLSEVVSLCNTILWNGPLGVFEYPQFANGTRELSSAICKQTKNGAFSIAGGGDTVAAINLFNAANEISYISTGGGAFLEFIEGKSLPTISALVNKAKIQLDNS